jgi:NAD(P)H-flavin reductase
MSRLQLEVDGLWIEAEPDDSVLDACLRAGLPIPHSCRAGACRRCELQTIEGPPQHLLACQTPVRAGLRLRSGQAQLQRTMVRLARKEWLGDSTLRVVLEPQSPLQWEAGQYIFLSREPSRSRCYSIASPDELEFHIAVQPGGHMSAWLAEKARKADALELVGPLGHCTHAAAQLDEPLLLVGTGTGLAPLLGVARSALKAEHRGPIRLLHGSARPSGNYALDLLDSLSGVAVESWCLEPHPDHRVRHGDLAARVREFGSELSSMRVYLCGAPALVTKLQRECFLEGVPLSRIHADPFLPAR